MLSALPGTSDSTSATLNIGQCSRTDTGASGAGLRFGHAVGPALYDIGGYFSEPAGVTPTTLRTWLASSSLNTFDSLGSTTVLGY